MAASAPGKDKLPKEKLKKIYIYCEALELGFPLPRRKL